MLVLDASVAVCWLFEDEASEFSDRLLLSVSAGGAVVPFPWPLEAASALVKAERRKRRTSDQARKAVALLEELPIRVDTEGIAHAFTDTLRIARAHNISVYDASYLELAVRVSLPLATLDEPLKGAARRMRVGLLEP